MNIYKLLGGVLFTIFIVIVSPVLLTKFGGMPSLAPKGWMILIVTIVVLSVKIIVSDLIARETLFYKLGYDNCQMALGAMLTAVALQLSSKTDLFPGVDNIAGINAITSIFPDPVYNRLAQLFILLVISLCATLLTAQIAAAIKHDKPKKPAFLSFLNTAIGAVTLASYIFIIITKG